jgi:hypothetical protein
MFVQMGDENVHLNRIARGAIHSLVDL